MMTLGGYTFEQNPDNPVQIIVPEKTMAVEKTWAGVQIWEWPAQIAGVPVALTWKYMPSAQWSQLQAMYVAGGSYVFDPETDATYNVVINPPFKGVFHLDQNGPWRKDCEVNLTILSQAS